MTESPVHAALMCLDPNQLTGVLTSGENPRRMSSIDLKRPLERPSLSSSQEYRIRTFCAGPTFEHGNCASRSPPTDEVSPFGRAFERDPSHSPD